MIQIDIDAKEIGRNHKNTLGILGNAPEALSLLLKSIRSFAKPKKSKKNFFQKMRSDRYDNPNNQSEPLASYVKALRQGIPNNGILGTDMTTIA